MRVYVDTSALLPLIHRDDHRHADVTSALRELAAGKAELLTTSYTLVETGALVRRRLGVAAFRALGEVVDRSMEIVWVDEELHHRAWREAGTTGRKSASLVDWVGFLVMETFGIKVALATDKHFRERGFNMLP